MMVSKNERFRLERQFDKMREHNERQTRSITRLVLSNTEAIAALAEIADIPEGDKEGLNKARDRAQAALDSIAVKAAAAADGDQGESNQDPTEDGDTERSTEDGT